MTDLRLQIQPGALPTGKDTDLHFEEQARQIGLKYNPRNRRDIQELFRILNVYLSYPDSALADKHRSANTLGELDSKIKQARNMRETYIRVQNQICNCCGFFVQKSELSNCERGILDVNGLGASTVVFFQTFFNIGILLGIMVVVYSIFSFATNVSVASESTSGTLDYLAISLGSKANNSTKNDSANTYYLVSSWLGACMLIFWLITLVKMKKDLKAVQNQAKSYTSVSDFSVVIEKMPIGYKKQQVQAMMNDYLEKVAPRDIGFKQLKVEKYNEAKPFYFNEQEFSDPDLEEYYLKVKEIKEEMIEWVTERLEQDEFSSTHQYREMKVEELIKLNSMIQKKKEDIIRKIISKLQEKDKKTTTFVFITFQTIEQRDFFLSYNNNSILNKIKNSLPCFDKSHHFSWQDENMQIKRLVIQAAPEPEDINWGNIGFGQCQSAWRKLFTTIVTLIMLGISFVIVYGLSKVQNQKSNDRFLSFFISLVISVINLIIIKVIQYMTIFEKDYTNNTYQISLAYKSITAQLLNSILIPIIVNIYIKRDNVYGQSGLTQDIFILAITSSFFPPLVRLIDPYYIFVYLKYNYYNRPLNKLGLSQYELNFIAEKPQYEIGLQYIYLISNFLFTCFFVSLQPIIPCFAILGLLFMFWVEKYSLYSKSQRPIPGIDTISVVMHQLIYFGGATYALGSLTWAVFLNDQNFRNSLVANLVAAGLGLVIFIFPYEAFVDYKENSNSKKTYLDRRIYFPAEYDRLNPVTKQEGVREYRDFLLRKKQQIEGLSGPIQEDLAAQLLKLTQNNTYKGHMGNIFGRKETAQIAQQIFLNQTRNVLDPKLLKSFLLPQQGRDRNLDIYASTLGIMNRPFSQRELQQQRDERMLNTISNPYEREIEMSPHRHNNELAQKNHEDNFKNLYKSTLNLSVLGLTSKQQEQDRAHTHKGM